MFLSLSQHWNRKSKPNLNLTHPLDQDRRPTITPFLNYFSNPSKPSLQIAIFCIFKSQPENYSNSCDLLDGMDVEEQDKNAD